MRGAGLLTAARVAGYAFSFVRSVVLARMLAKADFGLASLFIVTLSMLDFSSRMSLSHQVVQSKEGDTVLFRDTCHAMQAVLGATSAVLLVVLAHPVALMCDVPQASWAFALLGLAPLGHGLVHLDYCVRQRRLEYGPAILADLMPQVVITAAAWPLAVWLKDFRVILYLELARVGVMVVTTHLTGSVWYRWSWHREHLRSMFAFAWPLLLSGMLLTLSQQADRIVIGHFYSLNQVAEYSLAFSLINVPFFMFGPVLSSTMLPVLSRSQDAPGPFLRQYKICMECAALVAVGLVAPLMALSEWIVEFLYGVKYAGSGTIVTVLGAATSFRLLRVASSVAAMAKADTRNMLFSNVARSLGLILAFALAFAGTGVLLVAGAAVLGEAIAYLASILRLMRKQGLSALIGLKAALFIAGGCLASAYVYWLLPENGGWFVATMAIPVLAIALGSVGLLVFGETSRMAWAILLGFLRRQSKPAGATI